MCVVQEQMFLSRPNPRWEVRSPWSLPSPNPKQPNLRPRTLNWIASSNRRHPLDPPQCLVHAEHEILIFLYVESAPVPVCIQREPARYDHQGAY